MLCRKIIKKRRLKKKNKHILKCVRTRVLTIKKSIILYVFAAMMLFSFITLTFLSFLVFKRPALWFFSFCLCSGLYDLLRGNLLKIDNSFYLGTLLLCFGIVGYLYSFLNFENCTIIIFSIPFAISSFLTYIAYRQQFHIILAFSTFFFVVYGCLLAKKIITFEIFIAFGITFLVLLILTVIFQIKWRK